MTSTPINSMAVRAWSAGIPRSQSLLTISAKFTVESKAPGSADRTLSAPGSASRRASTAELSNTASLMLGGRVAFRDELINEARVFGHIVAHQCLRTADGGIYRFKDDCAVDQAREKLHRLASQVQPACWPGSQSDHWALSLSLLRVMSNTS